jgi:outer membrane protein TolC
LLPSACPNLEFLSTMNSSWKRSPYAGVLALGCGLLMFTASRSAECQIQGGGGFGQTAPSAQSSDDSASSDASYGPSSSATSGTTQNPFLSSVPEGKASNTVLQLSFKDALDRALRNNLALLLASDTTVAARGAKWQELSKLLPNISASATQAAQQIDLAALGFRFNFPGVTPVIGPIGTFDARAYMTASVFDWHQIQRERGARANESAAQYDYKSARELVVLATGNEYLLAIAADARVDAVQAQLETAQALYNKARDQQTAGVSPAIDTLRAQVELQTRQQQLIVARNDDAKQKLTLARTIGLPPGQEFTLTDHEPYQPLAPLDIDQALQRAYASRSDYQAAAQRVLAAEQFRRAATAEHYPTLGITANYGAAGVNVGTSHGVFLAGATLNIPIFAGGRSRADALEAESVLRQRHQELANLRAQIDYDVRTALLDLNAASEQVQVAKSALDLANQTLVQARDRFTAGVTDNLEVIEAQEAVASANENYISALYGHNVAKVSLARAIGFAEQGVRQYLEGKGK